MGPVTERERVDVIDVLRGFALFGILAANMRAFNSPAEVYSAPLAMWTAGFDRFAQGLIGTFISGKFITTFSVLFGLGFAIQMDRAAARGAGFLSFYSRRLAVLLLLGLAHGVLLWYGDILATYALLGFLLLLFRKRQQKTLLIWIVALHAVLLVMLVAFLVLARFGISTPAPPDPTAESIQHSVRVFSQGAWLEIQRQRLHDWLGINATLIFSVMWVLPRFLFGLWLWRSGFLGDLPSRKAFLRKLFLWGTALGVAGNAVATVIVHTFDPRMSKPDLPGLIAQTLSMVSVPLLSGGYAAGIALFTMSGACQWLHRAFAAIGRTALSNYLLQSVICTTLYYSYGFALFGKVGPAYGLIPTLLIYAAQLPLSLWWLRRCRFGPAEWLWRSLTYGKAQPLRAEGYFSPVV
jgi:uncharacterized protein